MSSHINGKGSSARRGAIQTHLVFITTTTTTTIGYRLRNRRRRSLLKPDTTACDALVLLKHTKILNISNRCITFLTLVYLYGWP